MICPYCGKRMAWYECFGWHCDHCEEVTNG